MKKTLIIILSVVGIAAISFFLDVTGLPLIVVALEKEKFTRAEIEKIMGGNVKDFFLKNLPK